MTIKMNPNCGHIGPKPNWKCGLDQGHAGRHSWYSDSIDGVFQIGEWNSAGETRPEEHCNAFPVHYDDIVGRERALSLAIIGARKMLADKRDQYPVFEIRAKMLPVLEGVRYDYGRKHYTREEMAASWGLAWYALPAPEKCPAWFEDCGLRQEPIFQRPINEAEHDKIGGYCLIARLRT